MEKILLINDSRLESIILKDMLSLMGYEVRISDEYDALRHINRYSPDYVIVNFIMKETRGDQLIGLIKMARPEVKCLLSSSNPISLQDFRFKKIDGVFQTPTDKYMLEKVLHIVKVKGQAS